MTHGDESLPKKKWSVAAGSVAAAAVIVLASFVVLHSGSAQESIVAQAAGIKMAQMLTEIPGDTASEETYEDQDADPQGPAPENSLILQAAADVASDTGTDMGQEVTFSISAELPVGGIASPALVYIDVSRVLAGSGLTLNDIASQASVSDSNALGSVGASSDGLHLLWTFVRTSEQNAILKFTVPVNNETDSSQDGVTIVVKTMLDSAIGTDSNCGVKVLDGDTFPSNDECVATADFQYDGVDPEALRDVTVVVSASEVSADSSATVSVNFRNNSGDINIGSGGFVVVDIRGVVGDNVALDEESLPERSSVSKESIMLPLPPLGIAGSEKDSGSVSFKVNISDRAADVVLKPVVVSAVVPGSSAVVPCSDFGADSVCSLESENASTQKKTKPLIVEVKADGIKTVKVFQGATTEYSVTVKNTEQVEVTAPVTIDIGEVLDNASLEIPPAGQGITMSPEWKTLIWNPPAGFQPRRIAKITFSVRVNVDAAVDKALTAKVLKTPNSECSGDEPAGDSCSATAIVLNDAEGPRPESVAGSSGLAVRALVNGYGKAAQVQPGQQLRYGVELSNTADKDITQVALSEDLSPIMPDARLVEGSMRGFTKKATDEILTWDGTTIPAGDTVFLEYRVIIGAVEEGSETRDRQIVSRVITTNSLSAPSGAPLGEKENTSSNCADPNTGDPNCLTTVAIVGTEPGDDAQEAEEPELNNDQAVNGGGRRKNSEIATPEA